MSTRSEQAKSERSSNDHSNLKRCAGGLPRPECSADPSSDCFLEPGEMAGSTDSPALPWGSSGVPATGAIDVGFEQTMRKFLLATVMEKMDERTGGSQLGAVAEGLSSEPDSAELQAILADPPVGLTAGKRIEVGVGPIYC